MNKFEQVSSDDHQMSVAGEGVGTQAPCLGDRYPDVWGVGTQAPCLGDRYPDVWGR